MILSNRSILEALQQGDIGINPQPRLPTIDNPNNPYDTTAVDLTLAPTLEIPISGLSIAIDISTGNIANTLKELCNQVEIDYENGYLLRPNQFVLGQTAERITLPIRRDRPVYAARVEGKSSRARCSIMVHFTAPTVHAGWDGPLTLEMINLGQYDFVLRKGMAICQLIFERVEGMPTENPSQFQGQITPSGSRQNSVKR